MTAIPNVIATVVLDSGRAVVTESEYDVYGEVTGRTGTADTEYDFAGEQTDDSTGLQYLRARCYAPNTGGFLAREPLSFGPAWAGPSYGYAVANPVNLIDPSGLRPIDPSGCENGNPHCPSSSSGPAFRPVITSPADPACRFADPRCRGEWDILDSYHTGAHFVGAAGVDALGLTALFKTWIFGAGIGACVSIKGAEYRYEHTTVQSKNDETLHGRVREKVWRPIFEVGAGVGVSIGGVGVGGCSATISDNLAVDVPGPWGDWDLAR